MHKIMRMHNRIIPLSLLLSYCMRWAKMQSLL